MAEFRERLKERIAVLNEVLEVIRDRRKEWDHIESADQALGSLEDEFERRVKATAEAWRTSG